MKTEEVVSLSKYLEEEIGTDIGRVISSKDNILKVRGLKFPKINEIVQIGEDAKGLILQYTEIETKIGVFSDANVIVGDVVTPTNEIIKVGFSKGMLGRVVDFLGNPIDGGGNITFDKMLPMEQEAQPLIVRKPVDTPLKTGILSIDSLIPVGRGQRELIIGDRETGKTQIALDAILAQKRNANLITVYVAIGQKLVKTKEVYQKLIDQDAMESTIIVNADASSKQICQYMVPYAATSIAEEFMNEGKDVLIIYDDLTKHADVYRSLSLMLENPPGREAFPGDIFYLHSRLLERSANLEVGGSLTALPIIETQEGDISAYIPTNVIGITDGQLFTNAKLFKSNIRPAVDLGLSVSRVGSSAQSPTIKALSRGVTSDYAKYTDIKKKAFSGGELVGSMQRDFDRGEILAKLFVQDEMAALSEVEQAALLYAYQKELVTKETVDTLIKNLRDNVTAEEVAVFEERPKLTKNLEEILREIIKRTYQNKPVDIEKEEDSDEDNLLKNEEDNLVNEVSQEELLEDDFDADDEVNSDDNIESKEKLS